MRAVGQLNAMLNLKGSGIDDIDGLFVFVGKVIKSAVGVDCGTVVVGQIRDVTNLFHRVRIKHKNVGAGEFVWRICEGRSVIGPATVSA